MAYNFAAICDLQWKFVVWYGKKIYINIITQGFDLFLTIQLFLLFITFKQIFTKMLYSNTNITVHYRLSPQIVKKINELIAIGKKVRDKFQDFCLNYR